MPSLEISNEDELQEILRNAGCKLVVVAFTSKHCGPCRLTNPRFESLSDQMPDIVFVKIDVNQADEFVEKYQIKGVPTFYFYRRNQEVYHFQGGNPDYLCRTVEDLRFRI